MSWPASITCPSCALPLLVWLALSSLNICLCGSQTDEGLSLSPTAVPFCKFTSICLVTLYSHLSFACLTCCHCFFFLFFPSLSLVKQSKVEQMIFFSLFFSPPFLALLSVLAKLFKTECMSFSLIASSQQYLQVELRAIDFSMIFPVYQV